MQKLFLRLIFIITALLTFSACEKEEGYGGNSKIKGVIVEKVYDTDFTQLQYTQVASDEDVYIVFGDDEVYGDNTNTSASGNFEFNYLNKGDYSIYYYSDDTTEANRGENIALSFDLSLGKRETANLDTLYRYKFIDFNDGKAEITGNVQSVNYTKNFLAVIDTTDAQNYDVFIVYNNHNKFDDRERTKYDGDFTFSDLAIGHYTVYVLSVNPTSEFEQLTVLKEIDITSINQKVDLGTLYIKQED